MASDHEPRHYAGRVGPSLWHRKVLGETMNLAERMVETCSDSSRAPQSRPRMPKCSRPGVLPHVLRIIRRAEGPRFRHRTTTDNLSSFNIATPTNVARTNTPLLGRVTERVS